jgi:hypothetical protein
VYDRPVPDEDPTEPQDRPESEPLVEERRHTELFGVPAMILVLALIAVIKGIITENLGFTIVGAVVAGGVFVVIGLAMTIAKRD